MFLVIVVHISVIVGEGEADDIIVSETVDSPLEPWRPAGATARHTAGLKVFPQLDGLTRPQLGWSPDTGPADPPHLRSKS